MRVVSQDHTVDIDYESATFEICEDMGRDYFYINAWVNNREYIMATYENQDDAIDALIKLSNYYKQFIVRMDQEQSVLVEELDAGIERPFKSISFIELPKNRVYVFPEDE